MSTSEVMKVAIGDNDVLLVVVGFIAMVILVVIGDWIGRDTENH